MGGHRDVGDVLMTGPGGVDQQGIGGVLSGAGLPVSVIVEEQIFSGVTLTDDYPELGECALVCVTEMVTKEAIDHMADSLLKVVNG